MPHLYIPRGQPKRFHYVGHIHLPLLCPNKDGFYKLPYIYWAFIAFYSFVSLLFKPYILGLLKLYSFSLEMRQQVMWTWPLFYSKCKHVWIGPQERGMPVKAVTDKWNWIIFFHIVFAQRCSHKCHHTQCMFINILIIPRNDATLMSVIRYDYWPTKQKYNCYDLNDQVAWNPLMNFVMVQGTIKIRDPWLMNQY